MEIDTLLKSPLWSKALYINEKFKFCNFKEYSVGYKNTKKWLHLFKENTNILDCRINSSNINSSEFEQVIQNDTFKCEYDKLKWHIELSETFTKDNDFCIDEFIKHSKKEIPFFEFSIPFLKRSIEVINDELKQYSTSINISKVIEIDMEILLDIIKNLSIKTLIYELNNSRIKGELKGKNAYDRYLYFINSKIKNNEDILNLLLKYPVMTRLILESMANINSNLVDAIKKLVKDKSEIEDCFGIQLGDLKSIKTMGDFHNSKKCVLKFEFSNDCKILYKPRDLSIDKEFQNLLIWFNEQGISKSFKTLKIISKDDYGWQEYAPHKECISNKQVINFFERQGQYLALMYMLNGSDMHFENIIANGEHPIFIDLESLLKNEMPYFNDNETDKSIYEFKNSVLSTTMLPMTTKNFLYNSDISGIAGDIKQLVKTQTINNINTDMMTISGQHIEVNMSKHLPNFNNIPITPELYIDDIKKGFINCYKLILKNNKEFINVINSLFTGKNVRIILRPTIVYATLLEVSTNPNNLQSGIERNYLMDYVWCILNKQPKRLETISYENYDLLNGDIPFFNCKVGEMNLIHNNTNSKIINYFEKDVISIIIDKVKFMSNEDLNNQCNIIENSLKEKYFKVDKVC